MPACVDDVSSVECDVNSLVVDGDIVVTVVGSGPTVQSTQISINNAELTNAPLYR